MTVLLILFVLQIPLARRMVTQLRATERERALLQERALDTSNDERRRIAGSLHDGIVQDVSASALLVAQAVDRLHDGPGGRGEHDVAAVLGQASTALRESVGSLRSLLVEIYPPNLERAGLASVLADLAARLRPRTIDVRIQVPETDLPPETATLFFRVAQEALLNVAKHADASVVHLTVSEVAGGHRLEICDDGVGFDLPAVRQRPRRGHLGLSDLTDMAAAGGADLAVRTAPGAGTCLRLEVSRRDRHRARRRPGRRRPRPDAGRAARADRGRRRHAGRRHGGRRRRGARPAVDDIAARRPHGPLDARDGRRHRHRADRRGAPGHRRPRPDVVLRPAAGARGPGRRSGRLRPQGHRPGEAARRRPRGRPRALPAGPAGGPDGPARAARPRAGAPSELTEREREVLALVGRGLANKQIARTLGIREATVKAHLTSVFQRIGVRDRTSAALWAQENLARRDG